MVARRPREESARAQLEVRGALPLVETIGAIAEAPTDRPPVGADPSRSRASPSAVYGTVQLSSADYFCTRNATL